MALITAREQYFVIRTVKELFWTTERHKSYCTLFLTNLGHDKNICNTENDSLFQPEDYRSKFLSDFPELSDYVQRSLSLKEIQIAQLLIFKLRAQQKFILNEILKHPKRKYIDIEEVKKSLKFLQSKGFPVKVIADSAAVCFYPKENIKQGFAEMEKNELELRKVGYVNGFVKKKSLGFSCGSMSKDKRLQLCLYYMELPFSFNGSGIFSSAPE